MKKAIMAVTKLTLDISEEANRFPREKMSAEDLIAFGKVALEIVGINARLSLFCPAVAEEKGKEAAPFFEKTSDYLESVKKILGEIKKIIDGEKGGLKEKLDELEEKVSRFGEYLTKKEKSPA